MSRRIPTLILVVAAIVGAIAGGRATPDPEPAVFSVAARGWMPAAPQPGSLSESWFCPGVPATGSDGVGGEVVVANRFAEQMVGTVLVFNDLRQSKRLDLEVDGWSTAIVDLDATLPGTMVGAVIEVEGGGAVVEQVARHPAGNSVAPCANATSDSWYLADGFTVEGSLDQIVLANPFQQTVVVNLEFATREGPRRPTSYRGLTIPAESIRVVDLGAPGAGAQSEQVLAVHVEASRGQLVVGRSQHFLGGGRVGTQVTVATPELRDQWWFVDGEKGPGVSERFTIYNPTDVRVEVDVVFLGIPVVVAVDPIVIEPHEVATFDSDSVADLPPGRHATVLATSTAEPSVVVERAVTRTSGDLLATAVVAGATPRLDLYVAATWYLAAGPPEPTAAALIVYNADNAAGTVSVSAVGASGPVPVEGLQEIPIEPAGFAVIDLVDPLVLGRQLVITATTRVFVERSYPSGRGTTRTSAWAVPAG